MADSDARPRPGEETRVVIKKYANRRLYNTASSSYVTLEHLAVMVREGVDFVVYDARSNEDITRSVLTQIIFDEESRGQNLLPLQFLRQLIRIYGDSMQAFVPGFLEMSLDGFTREQERIRSEWTDSATAVGGADAYLTFQNQVKRNVAMFDQAMRMFSPFNYARADGTPGSETKPAGPPAAAAADKPAQEGGADALAEMKRQMEAMQRQIADLAAAKK